MKKGKFFTKLIILLLIIVAISAALLKVGYNYINEKINLMNIQELDKSDLGKTEEVYNDITDGTKVIAIFGSDARIGSTEIGERADSIMLCSIDTVNHKINFISIPRDTYVKIEGYGRTKINHAYSYGKEQLTVKTINQNFNLAVDQYVTVDFSGLINIINSIGGIELEITEEERAFINKRLDESYSLSGKTKKEVTEYGLVHLNGEQTLAHVRNRTIGSDFERARRQRDVMQAIVNKAGTLKISEALDLVNVSLKQVKTNVDAWEYLKLIPNFIKHSEEYKSNIQSVQLPSKESSTEKYINRVYYFVPNTTQAIKDFKKYVYGVEEVE